MSSRHARWLSTLLRYAPRAAPALPIGRRVVPYACAFALAAGPAHAATLRAFTEVATPVVKLSDLFDDLGSAPDRALGPAPAPGGRIVVEAAQLAAIARDYTVAWRPETGAERAVLERAGVAVAMAPIVRALREALTAAGAPEDAEVDLPGFEPPTVPAGNTPNLAVAQVSFDAASGRFTALLSVSTPDAPPVHARVSGNVIAMTDAAVLARHVRPGTVLTADDVRTAHIHAGLLRGSAAVAPPAAVGQALRHDMPPGTPLTAADLTRPKLVARNDAVILSLEASGLALTAQGVALEDGGAGDRIRVQNPSSHAVVIGEITGTGAVRVVPGQAALVLAAQ